MGVVVIAIVVVVVLIVFHFKTFPPILELYSSNGMLLTMVLLLVIDSWFIGDLFDCIFHFVAVYCCYFIHRFYCIQPWDCFSLLFSFICCTLLLLLLLFSLYLFYRTVASFCFGTFIYFFFLRIGILFIFSESTNDIVPFLSTTMLSPDRQPSMNPICIKNFIPKCHPSGTRPVSNIPFIQA